MSRRPVRCLTDWDEKVLRRGLVKARGCQAHRPMAVPSMVRGSSNYYATPSNSPTGYEAIKQVG